jgi:DNA helicase HerA-like ATPase
VQHALRAFTPKEQKAVKAAAETFRANPKLDVSRAITELGVGEALVSVLDPKGSPTVVERAFVLPPRSRLTPLSPEERGQLVRSSVLHGHYERIVDRESAYEKLKEKAAQLAAAETAAGGPAGQGGQAGGKASQTGVMIGAMVKSAAHAIGSQLGRQIIRGVLGSILGGRSR